MFKRGLLKSSFSALIAFIFLSNYFSYPIAVAEDISLPAPGIMVHLSPEFNPPILKGIKVHPDDPFRFDFIMDLGDKRLSPSGGNSQLDATQLKEESATLIKYFLASLTIPEKDLWVNLSPYEKDRIVPQSFGLTEMGRDLLAEDYILKQITASLIYPEDQIGKKFWKRVYEEATKKYGTTNIPVNTFNKVWIVPEKAVVYENAKAGTAYVVESKLKVMLEQDYLSLEKHEGIQSEQAQAQDTNQLGSQIVREIVIPELTKEVNENKNFVQLRQVYNSLILATWYKKKIKDSILEQVYANKNKVAGVNINDPNEKQKIYEQYLKAFKKGVYNYIKEDVDPATQETIPRKYFSGGTTFNADVMNAAMRTTTDRLVIPKVKFDTAMIVQATINPFKRNRFSLAEAVSTMVTEQRNVFDVGELLRQNFTTYEPSKGKYLFTLRKVTDEEYPEAYLLNVFDKNAPQRMSIAQLYFSLSYIGRVKVAKLGISHINGFTRNDYLTADLNREGFHSSDPDGYWQASPLDGFWIRDEYRNKGVKGLWNLDRLLMATALTIAKKQRVECFLINSISDRVDYYQDKFGATPNQDLQSNIYNLRVNLNDQEEDPYIEKREGRRGMEMFLVKDGPDLAMNVMEYTGSEGKQMRNLAYLVYYRLLSTEEPLLLEEPLTLKIFRKVDKLGPGDSLRKRVITILNNTHLISYTKQGEWTLHPVHLEVAHKALGLDAAMINGNNGREPKVHLPEGLVNVPDESMGSPHIILIPNNHDTSVVMELPEFFIKDSKTLKLIKKIKNSPSATDFAMTNDNKGRVSLTFKIKERVANVKTSLRFIPWSKYAGRMIWAGTSVLGPIAFFKYKSSPEALISLVDTVLLSVILALELGDRQVKKFKEGHDYYLKVLRDFYEDGAFTNGHDSKEVMDFYKHYYSDFVDNLDDKEEAETLMLLAGTLTKKEVDILRNKEKVIFEKRLELVLNELLKKREEFIKVHEAYWNTLREAKKGSKLQLKAIINKALKFYNTNDQNFTIFLSKQQKEEIAQFIATNLSETGKSNILSLGPEQPTEIQKLMYWDLELETAEEGEKVSPKIVAAEKAGEGHDGAKITNEQGAQVSNIPKIPENGDQAMNSVPEKALQKKIHEELSQFGFIFHGKKVLWDRNYNIHGDWRPLTEWIPQAGEVEVKSMEDLSSIEVEGMVPFVEASHPLFLALANIDGHRQPIVIKQYLKANEEPGYYAMAFIPGEAKNYFVFSRQELTGIISPELIVKRKKIAAYFINKGLHFPEEYIYTPDGNVRPIDAETAYFDDDRPIPNEEPAKAYIYSQLGGAKFYGLVKFKSNVVMTPSTKIQPPAAASLKKNDEAMTAPVQSNPLKIEPDEMDKKVIAQLMTGYDPEAAAPELLMPQIQNHLSSVGSKVAVEEALLKDVKKLKLGNILYISSIRSQTEFSPMSTIENLSKNLSVIHLKVEGREYYFIIGATYPTLVRMKDAAMNTITVMPIHGTEYSSFQSAIDLYPDLKENPFYNASLWNDPRFLTRIVSNYPGFNLKFEEFSKKDNKALAQALIDFSKVLGPVDRMQYFSFSFDPTRDDDNLLNAFVDEIAGNMSWYMKSIERLYKPLLKEGEESASERRLSKEDVQIYLALLNTVVVRWREGNEPIVLELAPMPQEPAQVQVNTVTFESVGRPSLKGNGTKVAEQSTPIKEKSLLERLGITPGQVKELHRPELNREPKLAREEKPAQKTKLRPATLPIRKEMTEPKPKPEVKKTNNTLGINQVLGKLLHNPVGLANEVSVILTGESKSWDYVEAQKLGATLSIVKSETSDANGGYSARVGTIIHFSENKTITIRKDYSTNQIVVIPSGWDENLDIVGLRRRLGLDAAMLNGGIDLNNVKDSLQVQNQDGEIKFHMDPAMLAQLQNAPGFVPVIISVQPLKDLTTFLEVY